MGRGAYDTTYVCSTKDSAAAVAIAMHDANAAEAAVSILVLPDSTIILTKQQKIAAVEAAEAAQAKLIRSKKSRGIMAARKTAKEQAAGQADTYESEGDSDTTTKP
jgi:mannose-1-phosphate guanylyltransferase